MPIAFGGDRGRGYAERIVERLKAGDKDAIFRDSDLVGFGVRILAAGTKACAWFFKITVSDTWVWMSGSPGATSDSGLLAPQQPWQARPCLSPSFRSWWQALVRLMMIVLASISGT